MEGLATLYIIGPTASGKSGLAMRIAREYDGEIVCADSQTIRRNMDIGTAKPTRQERAEIVHHMLDVIDPYDDYSLDDYLKVARNIICDIHKRNKIAIVVGGTGLYIDALYFNYSLPQIKDATELEGMSIDELQIYIRDHGYEMPGNSQNPRHLINVIKRAGVYGVRSEPEKGSRIIGIAPSREVLLERIHARIGVMFAEGFMDEVRAIVAKYGRPPRSFDAIGYRIAMRVIDGEIDEAKAKELFEIADRQYAKRQMSWLKRNPHIEWYESAEAAYRSFVVST